MADDGRRQGRVDRLTGQLSLSLSLSSASEERKEGMDEVEGALLRQELAVLKAQISAYEASPRQTGNGASQGVQVDTATVWSLLKDNDAELERLLRGEGGREDGAVQRKRRKVSTDGEELEQARRLVRRLSLLPSQRLTRRPG